jgi:hypothetical protein
LDWRLGPRADLVSVEKRKTSFPAGNPTQAVQLRIRAVRIAAVPTDI